MEEIRLISIRYKTVNETAAKLMQMTVGLSC